MGNAGPKAEATGYTWLIVQSLSPPPNTSFRRGLPLSSSPNHSRGSFELKPLDIQTRLPPGVLYGRSLWTSLRTRHDRCPEAHRNGMGYPSWLHKSGILSRRLPKLSPIDYDQCEIIEDLYREILETEDRDALHRQPLIQPLIS